MSEERTINGLRVTIGKDKAEMSRLVADLILERIKSKPKINIMLPTGTTPEGIYEILKDYPPKVFKKVTFFNLDEYCEKVGEKFKMVSEKDSKGYRYYMWHKFFKHIKSDKHYFPDLENHKKPGSFDSLIEEKGGIDLCLSATGEDGHTGFIFPGSKFDSVTRLVRLNNNIREVNNKLTGHQIPLYGITVGMKTIMKSREIVFLVCGKRKAPILSKFLKAKRPAEKIPVTAFLAHQNCRVFVDKEALDF